MTPNSPQAITQVLQQDSKALDSLFAKLKQLKQLQEIFVNSIKPELALHCQVVNLEKGCLTIMTQSAAWATQVRYQTPDILSALRQHPLLYGLGSLNCKVRPSQSASVSTHPSQRPMASISANTSRIILAICKAISHSRLKAIMEKIALRVAD